MTETLLVVLAVGYLAGLGGWFYHRRVRIDRPPIGVVNLRDAVLLVVALVLMPYLYLALPLVAVTAVLAVVVLTALYMTLEPLLPRMLLWAVCLGLIGADIALGLTQGVTSTPFLLVNDVVLLVVVVGASNLWAQSGMKAREVAILAGVLTVYDAVATWQLSVMEDVLDRLAHVPLFPMVAWGLSDPATSLRIGLGDLLILTVAPLVLRKAFGRTAGIVALLVGLAVLTGVLTALVTGLVTTSIPVMALLGPAVVAQYLFWRKRFGVERTTVRYLREEPLEPAPVATAA